MGRRIPFAYLVPGGQRFKRTGRHGTHRPRQILWRRRYYERRAGRRHQEEQGQVNMRPSTVVRNKEGTTTSGGVHCDGILVDYVSYNARRRQSLFLATRLL